MEKNAEKESMESSKNIISIPGGELPKFKGLGEIYFRKMLENKNEIAYTIGLTGEEYTFGSILEKSIRAAITMKSKGLKPLDIISICSYNILDSHIAYFGSLFIGAISANLEPDLPFSDTVHLLEQVRPKMVFPICEAVELMENSLKDAQVHATIVVFGESHSAYLQFSDFLLPSPKEEADFSPYQAENIKDTAAIIFSSGSTGLPKGICLTHIGILRSGYEEGIPKQLVTLFFTNLYWIATSVQIAFCILHGSKRIMHPKFDAYTAWDLIKKHKVQLLYLTSPLIIEMCKNGRPKHADTSNLATIKIGGGPISEMQLEHVRACFPNTIVIQIYAQTETSGKSLALLRDPALNLQKYNSVGTPHPGFSYKIVDVETEEILGANQEGELRIKSDSLMKGYYKMDAEDVWDSEGFLKTGDIAYYDEDQCFFIVDRIKDLLKYRMWHISPVKLENILNAHPAVNVSLVIGVPHDVDGEHPLAVVVLKESFVGQITAEELRKFVDDQVGDQFKLRGGVKFVEKLPITVTYKLSRRELRKMV